MQDQRERDEKSVHIFIGLLLCALITVVGLGVLSLVDELFTFSEGLSGSVSRVIIGGAVLAAVAYLYRHRRS